jgi:uncharacterized protein
MINKPRAFVRCVCVCLLFVQATNRSPGSTIDTSRPRSLYIPMRDGVRIAIDVWLPAGLPADQKIPAIMRATRYWRAQDNIPRGAESDSNSKTAQMFNNAGYALVLVDARGTGASYGSRAYEMTSDEVEDYGQVADWIAAQPWSNRKIGATGVSYSGNAAEMLVVNRRPEVAAVAPLFNDFNYLDHLAYPGGLFLDFYTDQWGGLVDAMDRDDICAVAGVDGEECEKLRARVRGVKPVDDDPDRALLAQAVAQHRGNVRVAEAARRSEFRDDPFGPSGITDLSRLANPSGHVREISAAGTPMFIRVGWLDAATVNGALGRFLTLPNPQTVIIGPWSHGGGHDTDPFLPRDSETQPSLADQTKEIFGFFNDHLKDGARPAGKSSIRYYTLGAGTWTETEQWPPHGFDEMSLYFGPSGLLSTTAPQDAEGGDVYAVDQSATTGTTNRWHTNIGGGDVIYPDRAKEDKKLLTYTSGPMETDMEITGHPLVTLFASSDSKDGAFFAYLEDVDDSGRVTYVTEGELRGICRQVSRKTSPYRVFGPYRTFERKDAKPFIKGEVAELTFDLWATSVLIRKGHRIRIAISGADAGNFASYPLKQKDAPTIRIERNRRFASKAVLPVRAR